MFYEAVELRWNNDVLEYRSLIINEDDSYSQDGCCSRQLSVGGYAYTNWVEVPQKEKDGY